MSDLKFKNLETLLISQGILYETNSSFKKWSTYKLGGNSPITILPSTTEEFANSIKLINASKFETFNIIGGGSNILVSDSGFRFPVILLINLNSLKCIDDKLVCGAGVPSSAISEFALQNQLSGCEFLTDLPGSIGGAAFMNARAFGSEISDIIIKSTVVNSKGEISQIDLKKDDFQYKVSPFRLNKNYISEITFQLTKSETSKILDSMKQNRQHRKKNGEDKFPSCGCVFKNPRNFGVSAGKLIDNAGLKGFGTENVWVHKNHANFIVHNMHASSSEVREVMEKVRNFIKQKNGVELEYEVEFEGNWNK